MITRRGWTLAGSTLLLVVLGRILGITELYGLAVAAVVFVVAARVHVARGPGEIAVSSQVTPPVVHVGDIARLELVVENRGRSRSRRVQLRDLPYRGRQEPIPLGEVEVPPLPAGESAKILVELLTGTRGAFELAGMAVAVEDPLGLACRGVPIGGEARLLVLPRIEQLEDLAPFSGFSNRDETSRSTAARLGSGLSSFRRYAEGDDLRLVHWKTTARVGELMVREGGDPEAPESHSVTVVLDCRRSVHTAETFETAVSTAASILDAAASAGAALRLLTTAGIDTGLGTDAAHLEAALVELAVADMKNPSGNRSLKVAGDRNEGPGLVVTITTPRCGERDLEMMLSSRRSPGVVLVLVGGNDPQRDGDGAVQLVNLPAGGSVRAAWSASFGMPADLDIGTVGTGTLGTGTLVTGTLGTGTLVIASPTRADR